MTKKGVSITYAHATLLRRALAEHSYEKRVRISAVEFGVNGTPTFFIKQARYDGPHDFDSLLAAIEDAAEQNR